ncbi:hypothetical protein ACWESC_13515, partial [Staphylococcus xylosus]
KGSVESEVTDEDKGSVESEVTNEDKGSVESEVTNEDKGSVESEVTNEDKGSVESEVTDEDEGSVGSEVTNGDEGSVGSEVTNGDKGSVGSEVTNEDKGRVGSEVTSGDKGSVESEVIDKNEIGIEKEASKVAIKTNNSNANAINQSKNNNQRIAALADVTLLDNMELSANHENGALNLKLEGRPLIGLGIGNTYPTFQLPPQFHNLMTNSNFKNAITLKYDLPGVAGIIRNKGTVKNSDLKIDPNTGIIYGTVNNLVNLGVGSRVTYTLEIDLKKLTENGILPESNKPGRHEYNFSSAVGSGLIDLDILANNGNETSIIIED